MLLALYKRAAPEAAAARECLGRNRGGLRTKIHAAVDALVNPSRMLLPPRQRNDVAQGPALLGGYSPGAALANRGDNADDTLRRIREAGAEAVIPPKSDRNEARVSDRELHRERNEVERFFGRLKLNRRVATRYEKTGQNYVSVVFRAWTLVLLR